MRAKIFNSFKITLQEKKVAEVVPFRGILYNTSKVTGGDVVAPPYDIISDELRKKLYNKSPYNIVRIDAGEEYDANNESENKYMRAARYMAEWLRESTLIRSDKPCFYAYEMEYKAQGSVKKLHGFFGGVRLEELGKGVYPHEETHSKPKIDRLNLLTACKANTSPIFSLYDSPERKASSVIERITQKTRPYIEAEDINSAFHRLWLIEKDEDIAIIKEDLVNKAIFIADGHHRYETALEYRRLMRERSGKSTGNELYNYVLMFLANVADGEITILPTHRVVRYSGKNALKILSDYFEINKLPVKSNIIDAMRGRTQTFGFYQKGDEDLYLLSYKGDGLKDIHTALKGLDVVILHDLILRELLKATKILYEMDASEAMENVRGGDYDAVFFLNPTRVEDVERVALSSTKMPPKSTYFYPKVMTGFVINSLRNSI